MVVVLVVVVSATAAVVGAARAAQLLRPADAVAPAAVAVGTVGLGADAGVPGLVGV